MYTELMAEGTDTDTIPQGIQIKVTSYLGTRFQRLRVISAILK